MGAMAVSIQELLALAAQGFQWVFCSKPNV